MPALKQHQLRNIFYQYEQRENRLTHALFHTLERDLALRRRILEFALERRVLRPHTFSLACQALPGEESPAYGGKEPEQRGRPDGWIYQEEEGLAVLVESKIEDRLTSRQIERHFATAIARRFSEVVLIAITADRQPPRAIEMLHGNRPVRWLPWQELYCWLRVLSGSAAAELAEYMDILDDDLVAQGFGGARLTQFAGIRFGEEPYSYVAAKAHVRDLRELLATELKKAGRYNIGDTAGRNAITDDADGVWDYIPLGSAAKDGYQQPHITLAIGRSGAKIQFTIPNAAQGKYWRRLRSSGPDNLRELLLEVHRRARKLRRKTMRSFEPTVRVELVVRHFYGMKVEIQDGILDFNVDCLVDENSRLDPSVKGISAWPTILHSVLQQKNRANYQFGLSINFPFDRGSITAKPEFATTLVQAAEALYPAYEQLLE